MSYKPTLEDKLAEEAYRKFVKRVDGNLPGPSSLYETGFLDGLKHTSNEQPCDACEEENATFFYRLGKEEGALCDPCRKELKRIVK